MIGFLNFFMLTESLFAFDNSLYHSIVECWNENKKTGACESSANKVVGNIGKVINRR